MGKSVQDRNQYYTLYGVWTIVKDKLVEKTGRIVTYRRFSKIVRTYLDVVFNRIIYKNQEVELYGKLGCLFGTKILCTEFNPITKVFHNKEGKIIVEKKKVDVMKDDGYFYFMAWKYPLKFSMYRFKASVKWKKMLYNNVLNGSDYPELCP